MIRMNKVLYNHCLCVLKKKHTFSLKFNDKMPVMFWFSTFCRLLHDLWNSVPYKSSSIYE